ncbi:MAG: hypothetical protein KAH72_06920, partial [Flavobacteriaceae bacterium]|nr:hypothetical protein [Flavobacteriaceae bacterium]
EMIAIINPACPSPTYEIDETKIMNALFKVDGLGDSTFKKISSYFTFYSLRDITINDTIDISDKARRLFNDKIQLEKTRYKELLQSPIIKRKRLLDSIVNGEILIIKYLVGSQPKTLRRIQPRNIADNKLYGYHLERIKSYFIDDIIIYELDEEVDGVWYDENKPQSIPKEHIIRDLKDINIKCEKNCDCWKFINSLQIPLFGETYSKLICDKYGIDFIGLTYDKLVAVDNLGEDRANVFRSYMNKNKDRVAEYINSINPVVKEKSEVKNNSFKDTTIVLTGTMSVSRDIIKDMLEELGAKISSSVSRNTDYLIYGDKAGSKLTKAESLGVNTLTEDDMRAML